MMNDDRRGSARLVESLPFKIGGEGFDVASETLNMSKSGLLCRVRKEIPLMTKIEVLLLLPGAEGKANEIRAKGVIVRSEKNEDGTFKVAIFFTEMSKNCQERFDAYLQKRMKRQ